jgi:hypothetical protein
MVGVANRPGGHTRDESRLLSIFANQVAVGIGDEEFAAVRFEKVPPRGR